MEFLKIFKIKVPDTNGNDQLENFASSGGTQQKNNLIRQIVKNNDQRKIYRVLTRNQAKKTQEEIAQQTLATQSDPPTAPAAKDESSNSLTKAASPSIASKVSLNSIDIQNPRSTKADPKLTNPNHTLSRDQITNKTKGTTLPNNTKRAIALHENLHLPPTRLAKEAEISRSEAKEIVNNCHSCQFIHPTNSHVQFISSIKTPLGALKKVAIDVFHVPDYLNVNKCLIAVDLFTNFTWLKPIPAETSKAVSNALLQMFSTTAMPFEFRSDNASYLQELSR